MDLYRFSLDKNKVVGDDASVLLDNTKKLISTLQKYGSTIFESSPDVHGFPLDFIVQFGSSIEDPISLFNNMMADISAPYKYETSYNRAKA
tara:strand:+ start:471 stop:743 length:273 start_codon:yes stop_codon:yes gene_type:complete